MKRRGRDRVGEYKEMNKYIWVEGWRDGARERGRERWRSRKGEMEKEILRKKDEEAGREEKRRGMERG